MNTKILASAVVIAVSAIGCAEKKAINGAQTEVETNAKVQFSDLQGNWHAAVSKDSKDKPAADAVEKTFNFSEKGLMNEFATMSDYYWINPEGNSVQFEIKEDAFVASRQDATGLYTFTINSLADGSMTLVETWDPNQKKEEEAEEAPAPQAAQEEGDDEAANDEENEEAELEPVVEYTYSLAKISKENENEINVVEYKTIKAFAPYRGVWIAENGSRLVSVDPVGIIAEYTRSELGYVVAEGSNLIMEGEGVNLDQFDNVELAVISDYLDLQDDGTFNIRDLAGTEALVHLSVLPGFESFNGLYDSEDAIKTEILSSKIGLFTREETFVANGTTTIVKDIVELTEAGINHYQFADGEFVSQSLNIEWTNDVLARVAEMNDDSIFVPFMPNMSLDRVESIEDETTLRTLIDSIVLPAPAEGESPAPTPEMG